MSGAETLDPDHVLLVFHQPNARRVAGAAAVAEALQLTRHLRTEVVTRGPYGDPVGLFYLSLPAEHLQAAVALLPRLGYTAEVARVRFATEEDTRGGGTKTRRWKGRLRAFDTVYRVDEEALRRDAPDRRPFLLRNSDGTVRQVTGYRGDSGALSRRALPVVDCRMLANLVFTPSRGRFLDPFAGAGGIVIEARRLGFDTYSTDIDPVVAPGLRLHGARHVVADVRRLPFRDACMDAVASEPPYHAEATEVVCAGLGEIARVVVPYARVAMLVADHQAAALAASGERFGWTRVIDTTIDRKGLPVHLIGWLTTGGFSPGRGSSRWTASLSSP